MAERAWNQFQGTLEKGVVKIFAHLTFGSSAVTLTAKPRNKGIATCTRTSEGLYVLTLDNKYQRTLAMNVTMVVSTGVPAAYVHAIKTDAVATTKAITFTLGRDNGSGVYEVEDPASGEIALIEITLSNSTAI